MSLVGIAYIHFFRAKTTLKRSFTRAAAHRLDTRKADTTQSFRDLNRKMR
jgi:hypothetical protein